MFLFGTSKKLEVKCATKDKNGNITAIGGDWGRVNEDDAINNIENEGYEYYVKGDEGQRILIHVVPKEADVAELLFGTPPLKKYLRTNRDKTQKNNLGDLPDGD